MDWFKIAQSDADQRLQRSYERKMKRRYGKYGPMQWSPMPYLLAERLLSTRREFMFVVGSQCVYTGDNTSVECDGRLHKGCHTVHNHPSPTGLPFPSPEDLEVAQQYRLKRMDIVAPACGTVSIFESPYGDWPVPKENEWFSEEMRQKHRIKYRSVSVQDYEYTKPFFDKKALDDAQKKWDDRRDQYNNGPQGKLWDFDGSPTV